MAFSYQKFSRLNNASSLLLPWEQEGLVLLGSHTNPYIGTLSQEEANTASSYFSAEKLIYGQSRREAISCEEARC
jgi:hypothetical protein